MHFFNSLTKWKVLILAIIIGGSLALAPPAVNARPSLQGLQDQIDALQEQVDAIETEIGVNWMSAWNAGTSYEPNDAVSHNGASYIATDASLGVEPPDTAYWDILALKGEDGEDGEQGLQGDKGDPGPVGAAGVKGDTGGVGSAGPQGDPGADGAVGPQGPEGPAGEPSQQGEQGPPGDSSCPVTAVEFQLLVDRMTIMEEQHPYCVDNDGDNFGFGTNCSGLDCNDSDSKINPDAVEICDGLDNDCDGGIDEDCTSICVDNDGDNYGFGGLCSGLDCDDDDYLVHKNAVEFCDGLDNDCDGVIDEDCRPLLPAYRLARLINEYRRENSKPAVEISETMMMVAELHSLDLNYQHPQLICGSYKSWSDGSWSSIPWTECCFNDDPHCMFDKPGEMTNGVYPASGSEIVVQGFMLTPEECLDRIIESSPHRDLILGNPPYSVEWKALGAGISAYYCTVWLGAADDPLGPFKPDQL